MSKKSPRASAARSSDSDTHETGRRFAVEFLLRAMNSTAAHDFLRTNRRGNLHLYPDDWKRLPIPAVTPEEQAPVIALVSQILAAARTDQQADIARLEDELDKLVNAFCGLTAETAVAATRA